MRPISGRLALVLATLAALCVADVDTAKAQFPNYPAYSWRGKARTEIYGYGRTRVKWGNGITSNGVAAWNSFMVGAPAILSGLVPLIGGRSASAEEIEQLRSERAADAAACEQMHQTNHAILMQHEETIKLLGGGSLSTTGSALDARTTRYLDAAKGFQESGGAPDKAKLSSTITEGESLITKYEAVKQAIDKTNQALRELQQATGG
jgi:hypothetical protein